MKSKDTTLNEIKKFHRVQQLNHCIKQLLKGGLLGSAYFFVKAVVLWQLPTVIFYKYQSALAACLLFYVILQFLRNAPRLKDSLILLDNIVGHNRASTL